MSFEAGGGGNWWDEEERKRREKLGIAGAPLALKVAPPKPQGTSTTRGAPQSHTSVRPKGQAEEPQMVPIQSSRDRFREQSQKAALTMKEQNDSTQDQLAKFFATANRFGGQDKFAQRLTTVEALVDAYLPDYPRDIAWQLASSPFPDEQLQEMLKMAHITGYMPPMAGQEMMIPGQWMMKRGYDPNKEDEAKFSVLEYAMQPKRDSPMPTIGAPKTIGPDSTKEEVEAFRKAHAGELDVRPEQTVSRGEALKEAVMAGSLILPGGSVVRGIPLLGRVIAPMLTMWKGYLVVGQGAGYGYGKWAEHGMAEMDARQATATDMIVAANEAVLPNALSNMVAANNPAVAELQEIKGQIMDLKDADAVAAQQNMIDMKLPGTEDLKADGKWSYEWMSVVTNTFNDQFRQAIDWQRDAIEAGDADFWAEMDGDINSPYWQEVASKQDERIAAENEFAEAHPEWYAFLTEAGIPITGRGWESYYNRLKSEGWPQFFYGGLIKSTMQIGMGFHAMGAAIDLKVRKQRSTMYQEAEQEFIDYVASHVENQPAPAQGALFAGVPDQPSMAWATDMVMNGPLKDDEQANILHKNTKQAIATLINERYSSAYLLTAGHAVGVDYEEVERFGREHPEEVLAVNLAMELGLAAINPVGRVYKGIARPVVAPTEQAFQASRRAQRAAESAAEYLAQGKHGQASVIIGGSKAPELIRRVFRVKGKDRLTPATDSIVMMRKAEAVHLDAMKGDIAAVARKLNGDVKAAEEVVKRVKKRQRDIQSGKALDPNGKRLTGRAAVDDLKLTTNKAIAGQYNNHRGIIGEQEIKDAFMEEAARAFGAGESVFPYLRTNTMGRAGRFRVPLEDHLGAIGNNRVRAMLTIMAKTFYHAPLTEKSFEGPNSIDRIYDAALHVSLDAGWANDFRRRWANANSKTAYQKLARELAAKANRTYDLDTTMWGAGGIRLAKRLNPIRNKGVEVRGFAAKSDELGPVPEPIGGYTYRGEQLDVTPDTSFEQYKVGLHKNVMWAPYRYVDGELYFNGVKFAANLSRQATHAMNVISQPLRRYTVAMGGLLLWQKHALTDTSRSLVELGPAAVTRGARLHNRRSMAMKTMDEIFDDADVHPDAVAYAQTTRVEAHQSEVTYDNGSKSVRYLLKPIRNAKGKITDLKESAHALRRISNGQVFRIWASNGGGAGGKAAVDAWLQTAEGVKFLARNGHIKKGRALAADANIKYADKDALRAAVREQYIQTFVEGFFERLDGSMPHIMAEMKNAARNGEYFEVEQGMRLIQQHEGDNAVLSIADEMHEAGDAAGWLVGKFMQMNKWNRDVVFDNVFNKTYRKLVADGADKSEAVYAASDIAHAEVARIHFDLANAAAFEMKHRWFAWFATKHRLYGTYLLKTAIERPMLAGAAIDIADYLEQRNEEKDVGEFDKHDLVFTWPDWVPGWGGKQASINIAPYLWLSEYPLESTLGHVFETITAVPGNAASNRLIGRDYFHPSPTPFGLSTGRWDSMILTTGILIRSPMMKHWIGRINGKDEPIDDQEVMEWIDSQPKGTRDQINRGMAIARAVASVNGEEITDWQAFERSAMSAWAAASRSAMKFYSGKMTAPANVKIQADLRKFQELAETDPEAASQFMFDNPHVGMMFNLTQNGYLKSESDAGHRRMAEIVNESVAKANALYDHYGADIPDAEITRLVKDYKNAIDNLVSPNGSEYNETFSEWYNMTGNKDFDEALGFLFPFVDADALLKAGQPKSQTEIDAKKEQLNQEFDKQLAAFGLTRSDSTAPLYKILKDENVDNPFKAWVGTDPNDLTTYRQEKLADFLARGGETGVYRRDKYLELVKDRERRELIGKGIRDGRGQKNDPFMAYLTPEQKAEVGWNSDPATAQRWREWADLHWQIRKYQRENGISATSKKGKAMWEDFERFTQQMADEDGGFAAELGLSRASMAERMSIFGVGSGKGEANVGWRLFLDTVKDYEDELDRAVVAKTHQVGVGPRSQTAAPITRKYLETVAEIAKTYPQWWSQFSSSYTLSKFGFYWRRPGNKDDFLFNPDEPEFTGDDTVYFDSPFSIATEEAEEQQW